MSRGRELHRPRASAAAPPDEKSMAPGANDIRDADTGNGSAAPDSSTKRIPPSWGGPLNESDYTLLESSWISREIADAAMLRRADTYEGREVVGLKGLDCSGWLIPYYWADEPRPFSYRLRRDKPDWSVGKDGKPKPEKKYLGAPGNSNRLYIPPGVTLDHLRDTKTPITIVEGEKKALALIRLAYHDSEKPRWIPIAIAGVWNWRGKVGKANGPKGERIDVKGPISDLGRVEWTGRKVFIVFDANVRSNDSVNWARKGISRELATRGAEVDFIDLPEDCGVNGVDDLLAAWGPSRVLELFEKPTPGRRLQVVLPPQFQSRPEGMFRVTTKGAQLIETQLTNFRASVATSVLLDDGVESKREFEIESELMGNPTRFTIPSSQFGTMDWPIVQMGPRAIIFPNQREHARAAIQSHSIRSEERRIYTHTGWRNVDDSWLFLHAGGAIGSAGPVAGAHVRMLGVLARYELRVPATPQELVTAVRASLKLVGLGPPPISFPLRAATCRAVLGGTDCALHLVGETGAFKSEVAALEQQFFGASMNRLNLPGAWSSTANALEVMAFHTKDALFVIDDFAPQGSAADVGSYHAKADRLFRGAGNNAGRARLDSSSRFIEPKSPRGLILSTGEDIPRGHSIRSRLLILELSKGVIKSNKLTECQQAANAGLYVEAMSGYLRWIAGNYVDIHERFEHRVSELRGRVPGNLTHARTPEMIANLQAAFETYLTFAEDCGAADRKVRTNLADRCWDALCEAGSAQSKHQATAEPTERFLCLVRSCLASGQARLEARSGGVPDLSPEDCGWRSGRFGNWSPVGDSIGWVDRRYIYLEPTAVYRVVQLAGRDTGEVLSVSEQVLKKRLHEKKLLASTDEARGTLTIRRRMGGSDKDVLLLLRRTILPDQPHDEGDENG